LSATFSTPPCCAPRPPHPTQDELDKLAGLETSSPEFNVTRSYLDWLISLPWGETTEEIFDLKHAQQVGRPAGGHVARCAAA
jgi:ATP-dependent Lon protease